VRLLDFKGLRASPLAIISPDTKYYGDGEVIVGARTRIDDGCIFTGSVWLGARVHVPPCCIFYGKAGIEVGDYSSLGTYSVFHSESDDFSGRSLFGPCVPDSYRPDVWRDRVKIGAHVLFGTRTTILPGVTIHEGGAVGAHSLVKDDCPEWTIIAGTPAKTVGTRNREAYMALLRQFEGSLIGVAA